MAENKKYEAELSDEELDQAAGGIQTGVSMNRGLADAGVRSKTGVSLSERAKTEGLEGGAMAAAGIFSAEGAVVAGAAGSVNGMAANVQQDAAKVNSMKLDNK
ncbi:MAG: hypothetical protein IJS45_06195 [Clostridia bacterium]|nr:hypothetical protein [Clostridia bacterium]